VGLSQLAASNALTRLRGHLKDELFLRGPEGLRPTPRALELAPRIRSMLQELEHLLDPPKFDPATARRSFRIAAVDYFTVVVAPALVQLLEAEAPALDIRILPSAGQAQEQLDLGEIDFAAAAFGDAPDRFGHAMLVEDQYACIMHRDHPLAEGALTPQRFAAADHLLVSPRGDGRGFIDDELARLGLTRRVALSVNHFAAAPHIVAATRLVLTAPRRVLTALLTPDLVIRDCPLPAPLAFRRLDLIWHARLSAGPAHDWMRTAIARAAGTAATA
jgi:DNA-binding transcriptional LysR family regulator